MKTYTSACASDLGLSPGSYIYNLTSTSAQAETRCSSYPTLSPSDRLLATSDRALHVLDPGTLQVQSAFTGVETSITGLKRYATSGQQCSSFMTSGRDGVVRGWDIRTQSQALEFVAPNREPLSVVKCNAELQAVVAGTELEKDPPGDVSIYGWDVRMPGSIRLRYEESHNDTITELSFLPPTAGKEALLLSAGTDGLLNIFDSAISDEDDALLQVIKSASALQHAGLVDGDLYGLGTDETLAFHALAIAESVEGTTDPDPCSLGDVREKLGCEYVVNLYVSGGDKPYLAVGSHSEQWLDLVRLKNRATSATEPRSWDTRSESKRFRLNGGHGEELVRDVYIPDGAAVVYTCGEDGMVRAWKRDDEGDEDVEMGGTLGGKKRNGDRKERRGKRSKGAV